MIRGDDDDRDSDRNGDGSSVTVSAAPQRQHFPVVVLLVLQWELGLVVPVVRLDRGPSGAAGASVSSTIDVHR